MTTKENKQRYNYHYRARKAGALLSTQARTIYVHYTKKDQLPTPVKRLREKFGYGVQLMF